MTEVEKLFALKGTPPFDRLPDAELTAISRVTAVLRFPPGTIIHPDLEPFSRLLVLTEGAWHIAGRRPPPILGVGSLLHGLPAPGILTADPTQGCVCLGIDRGPFHTIANECPEVLLGFLTLPAGYEGGAFA